MMRMTRAAAILIAIIASACGGSNPVAPRTPSSPVPPQAATSTLFGYVSDTAFRALSGVRVDVLDGPQAGLSLTSDSSGQFSFSGTFETPTTIRLSKEHYVTRTETTHTWSNGRPYAIVELELSDPPVNLAGNYSLTVTAASSCGNLPAEVQTRTYTATIAAASDPSAPTGTAFTLTVGGGSFVSGHDHIQIGVAGNTVGLSVYSGEDYGLVEQLDPTRFLAIGAYGTGVAEGSPATTLTAPLSGDIVYCATQTAPGWNGNCAAPRVAFESCSSDTHQLRLERR